MKIFHRISGELIIEVNDSSEDLGGVNLRGVNLIDADLGGANLRGVNLGGANLRGVNLRGANLGGVNLIDADLRGANLGGVNLGGANLRGVNLIDADLRGADTPIYCKWSISIKGDNINIGCKSMTIEDWDKWFNSDKEFETSRDSIEFKMIHANYKAVREYYLHLNTK